MNKIQSIETLIEKLNNASDDEYPSIIKSIDIPPQDFEEYAEWREDKYTRNCLESNDKFELLLLCWTQKLGSPIHGHNGQKCWVYQILGEVEEIRYKKSNQKNFLEETYRHNLKPGLLSYMDDSMGFHMIQNPNLTKAMTLHIYIAPITTCRVLNDDEDAFERVKLKYDNEFQLID